MLRIRTKANLYAAVVPVYFVPSRRFAPGHWSLFDGLDLFALTPDERRNFSASLTELHGKGDSFSPSHGILIEPIGYRAGLSTRLSEGTRLPPLHIFSAGLSEGQNTLAQTEPCSLARMLVIGVWLLRGVNFALSTSFNGNFDSHGNLQAGGYANSPVERTLWRPLSPSSFLPESKLQRNELLGLLRLLEPYYRPYTWRHDRLAVALASLWGAITSPNLSHSFIGLMTAIEAVVSTSGVEITHQVAERTAILVGKSRHERFKIYNEMRDVYKLRSSIVHGSARTTKGPINLESLVTSPKLSMVPLSALKKLAYLSCRLILAALRDSEYMNTVRANNDEDKQSKALANLFTLRILS